MEANAVVLLLSKEDKEVAKRLLWGTEQRAASLKYLASVAPFTYCEW